MSAPRTHIPPRSGARLAAKGSHRQPRNRSQIRREGRTSSFCFNGAGLTRRKSPVRLSASLYRGTVSGRGENPICGLCTLHEETIICSGAAAVSRGNAGSCDCTVRPIATISTKFRQPRQSREQDSELIGRTSKHAAANTGFHPQRKSYSWGKEW